MAWFLGIDTSNYTTSLALYESETGEMIMEKRLLPVKDQACGLRQSDAVFLHVKQLAELAQKLWRDRRITPCAVGVSAYPRDAKGSYMPCFLVGKMVAEVIGAMLAVPVFSFSHQQGHVAAALYSAGCLEWMKEPFYAFHVSGGTTEALLVKPDAGGMSMELVGKTLDLNAGQAIDRVGVMMGLSFPCGRQMEHLAENCGEKITYRAQIKGTDCCLSGLQNQCETLWKKGCSKEYLSKYCITAVGTVIDRMTAAVLDTYGTYPLLYAGGVMSNSLIRQRLTQHYGGRFAAPEFSSDNSGGIAVLAAKAFARSGGEIATRSSALNF
jgi:N6-L-threonylcarbamoyladenine synthase